MSRLIYRGDTISSFGKFLPTPIIESIKIANIDSSDTILESINGALLNASLPASLPGNINTFTITTSALFNSNDSFDSVDLFKEIFESSAESDSLFLNIIFIKNADVIKILKESKLTLAELRDVTTGYVSNSSYNESNPIQEVEYVNSIANERVQIYSIPFSSFINTNEFTSDFDENGNQVIKAGVTKQTFHIANMNQVQDLSIFATVSSNKFERLSEQNITKAAFAVNFGDISYEDIKIEGKIAKFGDPIFVDSNGLPYPNVPFQTIDGRFFKSDNITHNNVKEGINNIVNEYKSRDSRSLKNQINNIEYVIARYSNTVEIIPRLYKANNLSPNKSSGNDVGLMYGQINNAVADLNKAIIAQEQVAKRIYRNYKLIDLRDLPTYNFNPSYIEPSTFLQPDREIIYGSVLHDNIARYVPISDSMDYLGKAELPVTAFELRDVTDDRINDILSDLNTIIIDSRPDKNDGRLDDYLNLHYDNLVDWLQGITHLWANAQGKESPDESAATNGYLYAAYSGELELKSGKGQKKKSKKTANHVNAYHQQVKSSTIYQLAYWLNFTSAMYQLVFIKSTSPTNAYGTEGTGYTTGIGGLFDGDYDKVLDMHPPIGSRAYVNSSKDASVTLNNHTDITGKLHVYVSEASSQNWSAHKVFEEFYKRIGFYDSTSGTVNTGGHDVFIEPTEAYFEILDRLVESISNSFQDDIERKIGELRANPSLMQSSTFAASKETIANELWSACWSNLISKLENELGNTFDGYIRIPYYSELEGASGMMDYRVKYKGWGDYFTGDHRLIYGLFEDLNGFKADHKDKYQYYRIPFGSALSETIRDNILENKDSILSKLTEILDVLEVAEGFEIDTGLHDSLANFDIIIKKSGAFFVDLEKFIRKRSFISRYLDVDKFLDIYPEAQEITNNCINITNVEYNNVTYNTNMKLITGPFGEYNYDPTNPKLLTFSTILDASGMPNAYYQAPVASAEVRFQDFIKPDSSFDSSEFNSLSTTNESSQLVQRNFAFVNWNDGELSQEKTWQDNYRLLMFNYSFFIDDDKYNLGTNIDGITYNPVHENASRDIADIVASITDHSYHTLVGIIDLFNETYATFVEEYVNPATEQCSYNEYTQKFNDFFTSSILEKYPTGLPWFNMVAVYTVYLNIFSNFFSDQTYADTLEYSSNLLDTIRPETGTLSQLLQFDEILQEFSSTLANLKADAIEDFETYDINQSFTIRTDIETPVFDHIGDYTALSDRID